MRPADCQICGIQCPYEPENNRGDWVEFADFVEHDDLEGPDGFEYFCGKHLAAARALAHKTAAEALGELREQFKDCEQWTEPPPPPTLWQRIRAWLA